MEITRSLYEDIPVLHVIGDIDHLAAGDLEQAIDDALADTRGALLLDLSRCPFVDSGGLSVLLLTLRRQRGAGWLGVVGSNPNLLRVFDIVGLSNSEGFRILSSLSDLVAPRLQSIQ